MPDQTAQSLLIIDDDASTLRDLRECLAESGFNIFEAAEGRRGLELFRRHKPNLLFVGISSADAAAEEALLTAVAAESPDTPVIIIAAPTETAAARASLRHGAWDFMVRPVKDRSVLLHRIDQALEHSRLLKDKRVCHHQLETMVSDHRTEPPENDQQFTATAEGHQRPVESTPGLFYRMALPENKYEYVSPACGDLFGYTPEEFYGCPKIIERIIRPEYRADFLRHWKQLTAGERQTGHDYRILTKAGEEKWIHQHNTLVSDDNGKAIAIEGIITDVTRYKQTEAALRDNKKLLDGLMDNSPSVIYLKDREGRYLLVNKRFEQFCRASSKQILGKTDYELFPGKIADAFRENDGKVLRTGDVLVQDERAPHDDRLHVYFTTKFPLRDDQGEILGVAGISTDITEQKQAELALRLSEEKFRMLSDQSLMGIHIISGGVLRYVNEATARISGYSIDEMLSWGPDRFVDLIHPDDRPFVMDQYRRKLAGRTDYRARYEWRLINKSGDIRWMESFSKPIMLGDELADFVMMIDVTDRKQAEQALRESEQRMELALRGADLGMWDWYVREGRIVINERWAEMLGYSLKEIHTDIASWEKLIHPDDLRGTRKIVDDHLAGHTRLYEAEYRMLTKSGEWKWILDRGKVVAWDDEGQPIRATGTHLDLDARKRAERALRESETTLRSIFLAAPIGIGLTRRRVMEWANQQMTQLIGYTEEEYTGQSTRLLYESEQEFQRVGRQLNAGITACGVGFVETRLVRKDGSTFDANLYVSPLDPAVPESDAIVMISDVTEKKRADTEKEKLEAQLWHSQKMEAVGQLAGGVAHDFNNILTAILGNTELALAELSTKLPSEDPLLQGLRQIEQSAERAAGLTRQLLAFSRRQISQPVSFDLNHTLTEMEKMLQRLLVEDIDLSIHLMPGPAYVHADPGQIEQVIMNLVVNARDALPDGGTITMETGAIVLDQTCAAVQGDVAPGKYISLVVSDDGTGMSRAVCERIFEPFFTTKAVGQGTGLGLATVYGIVKQAGGHLEVYSEPQQGSSFKVYLPAAQIEPSAARGGRGTEELPTGNETILLTEDDESIRALTTQVLSNAGYQVIPARNGKQALELSRQCSGNISLLITDVIMPGMNGKKLSDAMTAERSELQTLYISGYTSNVIAHHGVLDAGVEFLEKPFSRHKFLKRVREVLDKGKSPRH